MGRIKIGWGCCDISTDKPVVMPGQAHFRISQGIHDPITATALVMDDGNDYVIFVSMDMVSAGGSLDIIRRLVKEKCSEIDTDKIINNVTHTHTGGARTPDEVAYTEIGTGKRIPVKANVASADEYIAFYTNKIADTVVSAWKNRSEGGIAYGYGYAVVAHSRRVCYFDDVSKRANADITNTYAVNGHSVMYGKTNDDNFSHYEAGADHFINIMFTFDENNKLTGAIVNVPCPSQNSEMETRLSASYWNETREYIRAKYGNIFILPQAASAGDLAPRILHYKEAQKRRFLLKYGEEKDTFEEMAARRDIGERIAAAFDEVYSWAKNDIQTDVPVVHSVREIQLSRLMITDEELEYCKDGLKQAMEKNYVETDDPVADFTYNTKLLSNRNRFTSCINRYNSQKTVKKLPVELHTIGVGDIAFVTGPFELYMDYQHRIQARSPFTQTFCIELCGTTKKAGTSGYLATERGYAGKGYSAIIFSCQVSAEGGQEYVEEVVKTLKEIKK